MPSRRSGVRGFPAWMAAVGGSIFLAFGAWAMLSPSTFYESIALFEPYNAHFVRDIGAFQTGLGAILGLAAFATSDALVAGLIGAGVGGSAHLGSHLLSLESGGDPIIDVTAIGLLAILLLLAGAVRLRRLGGGVDQPSRE